MCSLADGACGRGEVGVAGISTLQSIDELSSGLQEPGLKNGLTKGNNIFLLFDYFDFILNSLIIVKDDEENTKYY